MRLAHWFGMVLAAAAPLVAAAGTTCITDVMVVGGGQRGGVELRGSRLAPVVGGGASVMRPVRVGTWRTSAMTTEMPTFETPIDEIYWIRQKISAEYDHDPHKYFLAMVEQQKQRAREGQV